MKATLKYGTFFLSILLFYNCTEEIELETESFESVLVVEGTLTNEFGFQKIKLSRTYFLEENEQNLENNATVKILDSNGGVFNFAQNNEGIYISNIEFKALADVFYSLSITTTDGKQYMSLETELTPISQIDNLYVEYNSTDEQTLVLVDSENQSSGAQYFRYEYEETYKIVVPYYSLFNATVSNVVNNGETFDVELTPKLEDQRTCYSTKSSIGIIQTSTNSLGQDLVYRFPVRSIDKDDSKLRERYSILVKQYVQNLEAYNYYKIIHELGINESILSANQPGYVNGNVESLDNNKEKVIGYFEVSSVSSERLFFNHMDVNISKPPYFYDCEYRTDAAQIINANRNNLKLNYALIGGPQIPNQRQDLYRELTANEPYKYYDNNGVIYNIVSPLCSDCTSFSSTIQPDFWID
ncbi:DUF4249 domain-containing protein [uncultured Lacinutrix sp.]|uniref:DUF4249 domain-containing protein n=1 Tax=uncultured Lacinutrix sp. TaxID=574032 RepID=UPI002608570F|nr:DUF4249 domain-containing protein [uncultured Lacinutrix sp.]